MEKKITIEITRDELFDAISAISLGSLKMFEYAGKYVTDQRKLDIFNGVAERYTAMANNLQSIMDAYDEEQKESC